MTDSVQRSQLETHACPIIIAVVLKWLISYPLSWTLCWVYFCIHQNQQRMRRTSPITTESHTCNAIVHNTCHIILFNTQNRALCIFYIYKCMYIAHYIILDWTIKLASSMGAGSDRNFTIAITTIVMCCLPLLLPPPLPLSCCTDAAVAYVVDS